VCLSGLFLVINKSGAKVRNRPEIGDDREESRPAFSLGNGVNFEQNERNCGQHSTQAAFPAEKRLYYRSNIMKKLTLIAFLFAGYGAYAGNADTTFVKRPYYLGVTTGYSKFGIWSTEGTPFDMTNLPRSNQNFREYYYDQSIGIELAFPFLRKWECEANFEYQRTFGWQQSCTYYEKNNPPPAEIFWSATSHKLQLNDWKLRSFFSYELFRGSVFALNAGAGGWYSVSSRVGAETGMKCYIKANKNITIQTGVYAGYSSVTRLYGTVRASVLLSGTRTYRARPEHYYVRTYED
jgi:hypothetical protein